MSESDEQPPKPPKPMKKTSAVPLKKETVRVTLKSTSAAGGPPKPPAAPKPPTAKKAPTAPKPPMAPKATGGAPPPAPTIPLKTAGGGIAKPAKPAPTVQLATPGAPAAKSAPLKTQALATPGGPGKPSSQPLPKATVQLGAATQSLGTPTGLSKTSGVGFQSVEDDEEEETNGMVPKILSIVAFAASIAVLALQILATNAWDGWGKFFE